jgi:hypothetical protein
MIWRGQVLVLLFRFALLKPIIITKQIITYKQEKENNTLNLPLTLGIVL